MNNYLQFLTISVALISAWFSYKANIKSELSLKSSEINSIIINSHNEKKILNLKINKAQSDIRKAEEILQSDFIGSKIGKLCQESTNSCYADKEIIDRSEKLIGMGKESEAVIELQKLQIFELCDSKAKVASFKEKHFPQHSSRTTASISKNHIENLSASSKEVKMIRERASKELRAAVLKLKELERKYEKVQLKLKKRTIADDNDCIEKVKRCEMENLSRCVSALVITNNNSW